MTFVLAFVLIWIKVFAALIIMGTEAVQLFVIIVYGRDFVQTRREKIHCTEKRDKLENTERRRERERERELSTIT